MRSALVAHLVSLRKFQFSLGALCDAPKTPETSVCQWLAPFFLSFSKKILYIFRWQRAVVCFSSTWLTKRFGACSWRCFLPKVQAASSQKQQQHYGGGPVVLLLPSLAIAYLSFRRCCFVTAYTQRNTRCWMCVASPPSSCVCLVDRKKKREKEKKKKEKRDRASNKSKPKFTRWVLVVRPRGLPMPSSHWLVGKWPPENAPRHPPACPVLPDQTTQTQTSHYSIHEFRWSTVVVKRGRRVYIAHHLDRDSPRFASFFPPSVSQFLTIFAALHTSLFCAFIYLVWTRVSHPTSRQLSTNTHFKL